MVQKLKIWVKIGGNMLKIGEVEGQWVKMRGNRVTCGAGGVNMKKKG